MAVIYNCAHSGTPLRSLEKVLEDAQMTGVLNIGGRNMREYPQTAMNYDLEDTTAADFSKNKLSELPLDVCCYLSLETIICYSNFIRSIPFEIVNLTALTYLDLSRNQLSTLPVHVCDLFLEVLLVGNNKLVSLPPEIGRMKTLMLLDASCNELSTLPVEVGDLDGLKELNARRNQLVTVPEEISKLSIVKLNISCNRLSRLPESYRNIHTLEELNVSENPLENPPAQLCIRGKIHIFKYLSKKAIKDDKHRGLIDREESSSWQRRPPYNTQRPKFVIDPAESDSDDSDMDLGGLPNWLFIKPHSEGQSSLNIKSRTFPELTSEQNGSRLFFDPGSPPAKGSIASMADELAYMTDKMGELRRGLSGADSGYIEGDKRWSSSETSNEDEEARLLAERAAHQKELRQNRGEWQQKIAESRSYQPREDSSITFIDAGLGEAEGQSSENEPTPVQSPMTTPRPTPGPTPITTPTKEVDPFTKVNTEEETLMRQKTNYEDQKRRAREERLRKEMLEAKAAAHRAEMSPQSLPKRAEMPPQLPPQVNGIHLSPTAGSPPGLTNGPRTVTSPPNGPSGPRTLSSPPNGRVPNGPISLPQNGGVGGQRVEVIEQVNSPPDSAGSLGNTSAQTKPHISTTVVKEAVVVNNPVDDVNVDRPLSERKRGDTSRTTISRQANGSANGALRNGSAISQRRAMSTSAAPELTKKTTTTTANGRKSSRKSAVGIAKPTASTAKTRESKLTQPKSQTRRSASTVSAPSVREPVQNGPPKALSNGPLRKSMEGPPSLIAGSTISQERHEAQLARRQKEEEKQKLKQVQKDAVTSFVKKKTTTSAAIGERRNSGGRTPSRSSSSSSLSSTAPTHKNPPPQQSYSESAYGNIKPRSAFNIASSKTTNEKLQQSNFTVKREMRQLKEEMDRIEQLKKTQQSSILSSVVSPNDIKAVQQMKKYVETKLKMTLSDDLPGELMNGVTLCHLINSVRPHAVSTIYLPAGTNKLTAAKCRRNVENFIKSCQAAGVPKEKLCTSGDILEGKGLSKVALTIIALMQLPGSHRSSAHAS